MPEVLNSISLSYLILYYNGEIINLHFTIPDLPSGMMPLTAFNNFTSNLEQTIRLIGEDIIRKMESCTKKDKTRHRKFYNPEI